MCLLTEAQTGTEYRVASVYERDRRLLEFLDNEGIRPGVRIGFDDRNYDGTLSISIDKRRVRLGTPAAERIWVVKA